MNQKEQVIALLKSIETGEAAPVAVINPAKYIQHNLGIKDGLAGFGEPSPRLCTCEYGTRPAGW